MANVYLAVMCESFDFTKLVVIKEMRPELATDPEFVTMFTDEARLAARLNHPNVVQAYEVGSDGERPFMAMEYLEGISYSKLARGRNGADAPLAVHLRILADTLAGLHYAHELRDFDGTPLSVVHRDVSPQNVLVTYGGGVKVIDFGIARGALASPEKAGPNDFKGKLTYMAPEQVTGGPVDRRADVFCVGIMLWEAVTGKRLWGRSARATLQQLVLDPIPDPRAMCDDVSPRLAAICARALARRPEDRYPTAEAMESELEDLLREESPMSARQVGAFVAARFDAERRRIAAVIDVQLRLVRSVGTEARASLETLSLRETTGSTSQSAPPLASGVWRRESGEIAIAAPAQPRGRRPVAVVGGALFLFAAACGAAAFLLGAPRLAGPIEAPVASEAAPSETPRPREAVRPVSASLPADVPARATTEAGSVASPTQAPSRIEPPRPMPQARSQAVIARPMRAAKPAIDLENPYK